MRTQRVLLFFFTFLTALCCAAQLPGSGSASASSQDRQTPAINTPQTPGLEAFSGSGAVDRTAEKRDRAEMRGERTGKDESAEVNAKNGP